MTIIMMIFLNNNNNNNNNKRKFVNNFSLHILIFSKAILETKVRVY